MVRKTRGLARSALVGFSAACVAVFGSSIASAAAENETHSAAEARVLARMITAFEITRRHVQHWESNEASQALVSQVMDDLAADTELDVGWQSRFFLTHEGARNYQPDEFERAAIAKLSNPVTTTRQVSSADAKRFLSAVIAHKSCTNCHRAVVGRPLGYVSLRFQTQDE